MRLGSSAVSQPFAATSNIEMRLATSVARVGVKSGWILNHLAAEVGSRLVSSPGYAMEDWEWAEMLGESLITSQIYKRQDAKADAIVSGTFIAKIYKVRRCV